MKLTGAFPDLVAGKLKQRKIFQKFEKIGKISINFCSNVPKNDPFTLNYALPSSFNLLKSGKTTNCGQGTLMKLHAC